MRVSNNASSNSHSIPKALAGAKCLISLGANVPGRWGAPAATLRRAISILEQNQVFIAACSRIYRTPAHPGAGLMPNFYNAAVIVQTNLPPAGILRLLKKIERMAGRRIKPRWSARPLDLDLIDYGGRILNWPATTRVGSPLVLPHPFMHERGFVLLPLNEIAPHWRHPVLGISVGALIRRDPGLRRGITQVGQLIL